MRRISVKIVKIEVLLLVLGVDDSRWRCQRIVVGKFTAGGSRLFCQPVRDDVDLRGV
jgi:hypothetical protein